VRRRTILLLLGEKAGMRENVNYAVKSSLSVGLFGIRAGGVGEVERAGNKGAEV
jgi:hypothetical protein